jgi:methanogenic corrinoid protein MtbC1
MEGYDIESLINDILEARMDNALERLNQVSFRDGYPAMIHDYLDPTLQRIGGMWSQGSISLAQGYVAGKIAELVLNKAIESGEASALAEEQGVAVLGNIEDDFHALGRKMVASFLRLDGWRVEDLGNDVMPEAFVDTALKLNAKVIGASAMMLSTALNVRALRAELDSRGLSGSIQLAVGGAVFRMRPGLVDEVGGDGSAPSAMEAPALFRALKERAKP